MEITQETNTYNQRRYGKPWIAIVDFAAGPKGVFNFRDWAGDHRNGTEGLLEISANPGNIIAIGQKDLRKPRNSAPDFFEVASDGTLDTIGNKGEAYKHYKSTPQTAHCALPQEKEKLLARIAEIDTILAQ